MKSAYGVTKQAAPRDLRNPKPVTNRRSVKMRIVTMKRSLLFAGLLLLGLGGARAAVSSAQEATLYRDEFGVPHIYASTLDSAAFAAGYAQAEDRLEELLKNYRRASGTMAEVFGPRHFHDDLVQRLFRHEEISREKYSALRPQLRAIIEAYQAGIKQFMKEHPEQVPAWAQEIHPWDVVALGRYIIWGWPLGEAGADVAHAVDDLSTDLPDMLAAGGGPQRGAEELTRYLNQVYDALIAEVDRYHGSVIGFSGDAITCWFDGDDGLVDLAEREHAPENIARAARRRGNDQPDRPGRVVLRDGGFGAGADQRQAHGS